MKQIFDTDTILFQTLKNDSAIASQLTGGVYIRQRPDNSVKEDIVVNTIALSQEYAPQIGTSNINIHVADKLVNIGGAQQKVPDLSRLKLLSGLVLDKIRTVVIQGLTMTIEPQNLIKEDEINQHYVNIRINWNIHQ